VLHGIAAALPVFRRQGHGHLVTTVSTAGLKIVPTQAVYAATKNAVRTLMEGLRQESTDGVLRTTAVSPGFVRTELADSIDNPEVREQIRRSRDEFAIPPEAVARAIAFAIEALRRRNRRHHHPPIRPGLMPARRSEPGDAGSPRQRGQKSRCHSYACRPLAPGGAGPASPGWPRRAVIAVAASRSHASARGSVSLAPSSHSLRNTGSSSAEAREPS
jgi:hypothetical protein